MWKITFGKRCRPTTDGLPHSINFTLIKQKVAAVQKNTITYKKFL